MLSLTRIDKIPNFVVQIVFLLKQVVMFPIGLKVLAKDFYVDEQLPVAEKFCSVGQ